MFAFSWSSQFTISMLVGSLDAWRVFLVNETSASDDFGRRAWRFEKGAMRDRIWKYQQLFFCISLQKILVLFSLLLCMETSPHAFAHFNFYYILYRNMFFSWHFFRCFFFAAVCWVYIYFAIHSIFRNCAVLSCAQHLPSLSLSLIQSTIFKITSAHHRLRWCVVAVLSLCWCIETILVSRKRLTTNFFLHSQMI